MTRWYFTTLVLFISACTEIRLDPDCYPKNEVIHEADNWKGTVSFSQELNQWLINHYVPGTIDSYYTGVVCDIPAEFKEESLQVIFSGNLKDDKGKIQPTIVTGGQEFYFLELKGIRIDE